MATAQLTPGEADTTVAAYRACAVDRAKEKDPGVVPQSCSTDALQNEKAAPVLARYAKDATGTSFAHSLQTTLWVFGAVVVVAFLLMLAIPRQMRLKAPEEEEADDSTVGA